MAPNDGPVTDRVQEVSFINETAIAWSNLPEDEEIAIFTPVITHPDGSDGSDDRDPFEDLGRTLASMHPGKISHSPYMPKSGLLKAHIDYIDKTPTILLVICEPAGFSPKAQQTLVDQQTVFAQNTMREYHRIHEGTEPDALILLYCGRNSFSVPDNIGTCLRVEGYTADYWPAVSNKLLRGHE